MKNNRMYLSGVVAELLSASTLSPNTSYNIDRKAGIIRDCAICTAGQALNKPYTFSNEFIESLYALSANDTVKVNNGHYIGSEDTIDPVNDIAYIDNIRLDKSASAYVLRGDVNFYLPESDTAQMLMSKAEKQPKKFGLSIIYDTKDDYKTTKVINKATALYSTDFVGTPAANPGGLLSSIATYFGLTPKTLSSTTTGEDKQPENNTKTMKIATPMARKFLSRAREIAYTPSHALSAKAKVLVEHFDNNPLPAASANIAEIEAPDNIANDLTDLMLSAATTVAPAVMEAPKPITESANPEAEKLRKENEELKLNLSAAKEHTGAGIVTTHTGKTEQEQSMLSGQELWAEWGKLMASGQAKQAEKLFEKNKDKMEDIPNWAARDAARKA